MRPPSPPTMALDPLIKRMIMEGRFMEKVRMKRGMIFCQVDKIIQLGQEESDIT